VVLELLFTSYSSRQIIRMRTCKGCGLILHTGDLCFLCELEGSDVKEVYVNLSGEDKILAWQSFKSELCPIKLTTEKFIGLVKDQYRSE